MTDPTIVERYIATAKRLEAEAERLQKEAWKLGHQAALKRRVAQDCWRQGKTEEMAQS